MLEHESSNKSNDKKRLSIITDILILIPFIVATLILLHSFDISKYFENEEEDLLLLQKSSLTVEDENTVYINRIRKEYGITVMYGKQAEPFATRLEAVSQYDENILNNNLKIIYDALKKYPMDVFNMSISKENPTYIMIVDHFNNNNLALASRNNLDEYRLYISNTENLERAFHHEMYHVLEYYMAKNNTNLFSSWKVLNPKDFSYNSDTSKLNSDYVYKKEEVGQEKISVTNNNYYFVTKYSKSAEREDRAEIFAELMMLDYVPSYLGKGQNIRNKVDYIFKTINENITKNEFYCNQYIK